MDDLELLQEYAARKSEPAFASLVKRHVNLVYSAARRQVRDPHLADEIAQAVFLLLAEKAASIHPPAVLSGWLFRTTRFIAANALRREQRRQHYEREVMANTLASVESDSVWDDVAPLLDEAMVGLGDKDRDALLLRFFENKSLREVGTALGLSEDNAQKRVARALEKLRTFFARRGKAVSLATLGGVLMTSSVQAAPETLAGSITALALGQSGALAAGPLTLFQETLRVLTRARFKVLASRYAVVFLIAATALLVIRHKTSEPLSAPVEPPTAAQPIARAVSSPDFVAQSAALQPDARRFAFRVVDATNDAPLSGVKLTVRETADYPNRTTREFVTDRNGFGLLPPPGAEQKNWSYQIEVFQDGYVPKYVSWSASQGDSFNDFPANYSTKLERGVTIGGVVVSEGGEPVPGVRVVFSVTGPTRGSGDRERLTMMGDYHQEVSDAQGRWSCNHVPEQFGMITWRLIHREHQDVTYGTTAPEADSSIGLSRLPKADYLAGQAVMPMKRGLVIIGLVVDEAGRPVHNAKVTQGRDFRKPEASLTTDGEGRFRFQNAREKETTLTIQAEGFAPQDRPIKPTANLEEQKFILAKGGTLRGRVLDEAGLPIAQASVRTASDSTGRGVFEWRAKADAEGRFEWLNAPVTTQKYSVSGGDYDSKSGVELPANGLEHVITLTRNTRKRLRLTTRAFDAATRQSLETFKLALAEAQDPVTNATTIIGLGFSTPQPKGEARDGACVVTLSSYTTRFAAEVQAEGYLPTRITNVNSGQGEMTLEFELKKGTAVRGVVRAPDGQLVQGAEVMLFAEHDQVQMHHPFQFQAGAVPIAGRAQTDMEGRFSLAPKLEMREIIASHRLGFAHISVDDLKSSEEILLRAWGQVEGVCKVGHQPAVNQVVRLENFYWRFGGWSSLMIRLQATTDAEGYFKLEGVPPGERKIAAGLQSKDGKIRASGFSHEQPVLVRPGETTHVILGGAGRTVVGRISGEDITKPINWQQDVHNLTLKVGIPPEAVVPVREDFPNDQEYSNAIKAYAERSRPFWLSDAGKEAQRRQRTHALHFNPDGSFRVDDVPPGTYELSVTPMEPPALVKTPGGGSVFPSFGIQPIGWLKTEIIVPEASEAEGNPALDMGVLRLKPVSQ